MSEQQQPMSVQALVEAIDQRARQAGTEGATTVLRGLLGTVSDTLASIESRLAGIEDAGIGGTGVSESAVAAVDERLQALNARLGRLEEAFVRAVEDSSAGTVSISDRVVEAVTAFMDQRAADTAPPPAPPAATEPSSEERQQADERLAATLDRMASDLERLLRQEQSGQVVQLVEARMGAGLDAMVGRIEAVAATLGAVVGQTEAVAATLGEVQQRLAQLDERTAARDEAAGRSASALEALEQRLGDQLRGEGEQLTQRVAALAVSVERLRQSVDTLIEESAQTLGRKATEVGRRLASDWGLRGRRPPPANAEDRGRELGPGR